MPGKFLISVLAIGLLAGSLGGCSKCGWGWSAFNGEPQACRGDAPVR